MATFYNPPVFGVSYPVVATFADLPSAASYNNQIYVVLNSTGVWLINYKAKGFYISDGSNWNYLGDYPTSLSDLSGTINASQHGNQTDASLHAVATASNNGFMAATDKVNLTNLVEKQKDWISLIDNQYTQISPLVCAGGIETQITNNGGQSFNTTYKAPNTVWTYNTSTQKLTTNEIGRTFCIRLGFYMRQSFNNSYFTIIFKVNTSNIFEETIIMPKGAGVWNYTNNNINIFVGSSNMVTNGGQIFIKPNMDIDIASASFFIESVG